MIFFPDSTFFSCLMDFKTMLFTTIISWNSGVDGQPTPKTSVTNATRDKIIGAPPKLLVPPFFFLPPS